MDNELVDGLVKDKIFMKLYKDAIKKAVKELQPVENCFLQIGLNEFNNWFFPLCRNWKIKSVLDIREFHAIYRRRRIVKEFEQMRNITELKALSHYSMENPLDDQQYERMMKLKKEVFG